MDALKVHEAELERLNKERTNKDARIEHLANDLKIPHSNEMMMEEQAKAPERKLELMEKQFEEKNKDLEVHIRSLLRLNGGRGEGKRAP